ncbi:MAG: phosphate transport system protein [Thermoproteota archaeon]|nr:phosphate transport system protein [Thermoproteota archaeon]
MPRLMDLGLDQLTNMIIDMANLAEKAIRTAMEIFEENRLINSESVFQISEQLRFLREETSNLAVEILARYQPLARDLRFVKSCIDIAYDLSRFGRYAYDISLTTKWLGSLSSCDLRVPIETSEKALAMIRKSLLAFKNKDAELAKTLPADDNVIDHIYSGTLANVLKDERITKQCALAVALLMRHIERIADHACYIADAVVYIVDGEKLGLH